jgi:sugar lactone lactonase YvrE
MMKYRLLRTFSGRGSRPDFFGQVLRGIHVEARGRIHAVGDSEVKVFDLNGRLLRRWTTDRPGYSVAVDRGGNVFVGEIDQVECFDSEGQRVVTWRDPQRLGLVTAIGFVGDCVVLADAKDRCLRRFDREGNWVNDIGKDNRTKGFLIPNGVLDFSVDAEGIIHACNPAKHRIERYSLDGKLLDFFGRFGTKSPEDFPGCCNPTNLTLGPQGQIIVTQKAGPLVKVYDDEHQLKAVIGPEPFDLTCKNMDVACDAEGRIYVVDTARLTICVFAPATEASPREAISPSSAAQGAPSS